MRKNRRISVIACVMALVAVLASCGKEINTSNTSSNSKSSSSSESTTSQETVMSTEETTEASVQDVNVEAVNFTPPNEGDDIIVMKIKDYGTVKIRLFPEYAEKGVENFVGLAKKGYYDGLTFHRVINNFMIQGGDPEGTGMGGESIWGDKFDGGTDPHLIHAAGALAYANSGSTATNGSQFYIVTGEVYSKEDMEMLAERGYQFSDSAKEIYTSQGGTPWLDGSYTVFGQVIDGLDIIFKIQQVPTGENDKPKDDVIIESVTIEKYDGSELKWYISDYDTSDSENDSETDSETSDGEEQSEQLSDSEESQDELSDDSSSESTQDSSSESTDDASDQNTEETSASEELSE